MHIYFLRHGESQANVGGYINDDPSIQVSLTSRGRAQAEVAARLLSNVRFTHAYVSQFPRAQETAQVILRGRDLPLLIDARLNERRSGLDGQPVHIFNDLVRGDPVRTRPVNGESFLEQMQRMRRFLDECAVSYMGIVLAVSHENPILSAAVLAGREIEATVRGSLGNCEWLDLEWPVSVCSEYA